MARKTSRRQRVNQGETITPPNPKFEEHRPLLPMNPSQVDALKMLKTKTLTILTGPPGTAKTLLSIYVACDKLNKREIEKIYYVKPVVAVQGEQGLGFLPGSLEEKVAPHVMPVRDALSVFMPKGKADYLLEKKIIEFLPLEHLRGRSLHRCMIIADEMQNATVDSTMTILTRLGEGSSISLLGDVVQRDLANRFGKDGLSDVVRRLSSFTEVGHVDFRFEDIVRSGFVRSVIEAYKDLYTYKS
jgi:phosphate starvation-inducible PhoH-like protein